MALNEASTSEDVVTPRPTTDLHETWAEDGSYPRKPPARSLGRYVLLEGIGSGGMGEVYRAYDPELDRMIAIKRLTVGLDDTDATARLLREAQAIARLSHGNVVHVYDVGLDRVAGEVFIAMELVEGVTLREWLRQTQRSWQPVVQVFREAGEGLAAAHAQAIVHRDFKPDNVLVGAGTRAKVVDFGLAKPTERTTLGATERNPLGDDTLRHPGNPLASDSVRASSSSLAIDNHATPAGSRLGTPAYMSPEQAAGRPCDARSDQFSFAVALYEALVGHLPFEGSTSTEYLVNVLDGRARPFPRQSPVPRRIQRAILQALSSDPRERFDSMRPLLTELGRDPASVRRRWAFVGVTLMVGAAGSLGVRALVEPQNADVLATCEVLASAADELWTDDRRHRLVQGVGSLRLPYAAETAELAVARLDRWAERWGEARKHRCLADIGQGVTTERGAVELCLERNLDRQRRLLDDMAEPKPTTVRHLLEALAGSERALARCTEPAYLAQLSERARASTPDIERVEAVIERARQHQELGLVQEGLASLDAEFGPGLPEAWPAAQVLELAVVRSKLLIYRGRLEEAQAVLEEAAQLGLGQDAGLAAATWQSTYAEVLYERGKTEEIAAPYRRAAGSYERLLGPDHPDSVLARAATGHIEYAVGNYDSALAIYLQASERLAGHDDLDHRITIDGWIAETFGHLGRHAEAIEMAKSLLERSRRTFGSNHPRTVSALENLGALEVRGGVIDGAIEHLEAALAQREAGVDAASAIDRAAVRGNYGAALLERDRVAEATEVFEAALADLEAASLGEGHPNVLALQANLASAHRRAGRLEAAADAYRTVWEGLQRAHLAHTSNAAVVARSLGQTLVDLRRPEDAIAVLIQSLESPPADLQLAARNRLVLVQALVDAGRVEEARVWLDTLRSSSEADDRELRDAVRGLEITLGTR